MSTEDRQMFTHPFTTGTDTKELVERVRDALTMDKGTFVERQHTAGIAALSELEARLEAVERERERNFGWAKTERARAEAAEKALETPRQYDALVSDWKDRAEAAERERDEAVRLKNISVKPSYEALHARVAELEEALRKIEHEADLRHEFHVRDIARAALDRSGSRLSEDALKKIADRPELAGFSE